MLCSWTNMGGAGGNASPASVSEVSTSDVRERLLSWQQRTQARVASKRVAVSRSC